MHKCNHALNSPNVSALALMLLCVLAPLELGCSAVLPTLDPLAKEVTIYRDEYGVPHIVAENEPAAFFGYRGKTASRR